MIWNIAFPRQRPNMHYKYCKIYINILRRVILTCPCHILIPIPSKHSQSRTSPPQGSSVMLYLSCRYPRCTYIYIHTHPYMHACTKPSHKHTHHYIKLHFESFIPTLSFLGPFDEDGLLNDNAFFAFMKISSRFFNLLYKNKIWLTGCNTR